MIRKNTLLKLFTVAAFQLLNASQVSALDYDAGSVTELLRSAKLDYGFFSHPVRSSHAYSEHTVFDYNESRATAVYIDQIGKTDIPVGFVSINMTPPTFTDSLEAIGEVATELRLLNDEELLIANTVERRLDEFVGERVMKLTGGDDFDVSARLFNDIKDRFVLTAVADRYQIDIDILVKLSGLRTAGHEAGHAFAFYKQQELNLTYGRRDYEPLKAEYIAEMVGLKSALHYIASHHAVQFRSYALALSDISELMRADSAVDYKKQRNGQYLIKPHTGATQADVELLNQVRDGKIGLEASRGFTMAALRKEAQGLEVKLSESDIIARVQHTLDEKPYSVSFAEHNLWVPARVHQLLISRIQAGR